MSMLLARIFYLISYNISLMILFACLSKMVVCIFSCIRSLPPSTINFMHALYILIFAFLNLYTDVQSNVVYARLCVHACAVSVYLCLRVCCNRNSRSRS